MSFLRNTQCWMGSHSGSWSLPGSRCQIARTCERCGAVQEKICHTWSAFDYRRENDCHQVRRCERCGVTESRVVHDWGPWLYVDGEMVTAQFHTCRCCHQREQTRRFSAV